MPARYFILTSAAIVLSMGTGHLWLTFFSRAFSPRDSALEDRMKSVSLLLSKRIVMWKAWIGFNASHSMGPILFGLFYGYLSLTHPELLFSSPFLIWLGAAALAFYLFLAARYWFHLPLIGIAVSLAFYIGGMLA